MKVLKERDVPMDVRINKPAPTERPPKPAAEDKVIAAIDRLIGAVQSLATPEEPDGSAEALRGISEQIAALTKQMQQAQAREVAKPQPRVRGYHFDVQCDTLGNIQSVEATRLLDN